MTKTIEVDIYGQRYAITGEADEQYVRRLAAYVDEQMRGVAQGLKTTTPSKLAVLTAINIAHRLFESERHRQHEEADVERRVLGLMDAIDMLEAKMPVSGRR